MKAFELKSFLEGLEKKWVEGKCPAHFAISYTKLLNAEQEHWIRKIDEFAANIRYSCEQDRVTHKHPTKKSKTIVYTDRYWKKISTIRP